MCSPLSQVYWFWPILAMCQGRLPNTGLCQTCSTSPAPTEIKQLSWIVNTKINGSGKHPSNWHEFHGSPTLAQLASNLNPNSGNLLNFEANRAWVRELCSSSNLISQLPTHLFREGPQSSIQNISTPSPTLGKLEQVGPQGLVTSLRTACHRVTKHYMTFTGHVNVLVLPYRMHNK